MSSTYTVLCCAVLYRSRQETRMKITPGSSTEQVWQDLAACQDADSARGGKFVDKRR